MALTYSDDTALGTAAPAFDLPVTNPGADGRAGEQRALDDFADADALVVVFTCNHCPYAKHIETALVEVANAYQERGVAFAAISSNDARKYPDDGPDQMAARAARLGFPFPYLYDETQEVARAYGAVCTPDVFVYDGDRKLVYRGRFDETRPGGPVAHGGDLKAALDELLEAGEVTAEQHPAMGCSIKWK